jgi:RNA recognition motif-containing protein
MGNVREGVLSVDTVRKIVDALGLSVGGETINEPEQQHQQQQQQQQQRIDLRSPPEQIMSVYVTNLSWDTTEEALREKFAEFGTVRNVSLKENKVRRAPGYAFVDYASADSVQKAIKASHDPAGIEIDGRNLKVEPRQPRGRGANLPHQTTGGGRGEPLPQPQQQVQQQQQQQQQSGQQAQTVYVSNLSWDTNATSLEELFAQYGAVVKVFLKENKVRRAPGYAFVTFASTNSAQKAIDAASLDPGISLEHRQLKVEQRQSSRRRPAGTGQQQRQQQQEVEQQQDDPELLDDICDDGGAGGGGGGGGGGYEADDNATNPDELWDEPLQQPMGTTMLPPAAAAAAAKEPPARKLQAWNAGVEYDDNKNQALEGELEPAITQQQQQQQQQVNEETGAGLIEIARDSIVKYVDFVNDEHKKGAAGLAAIGACHLS